MQNFLLEFMFHLIPFFVEKTYSCHLNTHIYSNDFFLFQFLVFGELNGLK